MNIQLKCNVTTSLITELTNENQFLTTIMVLIIRTDRSGPTV